MYKLVKAIISFSVSNRPLIFLLMLACIGIGIYSYKHIPVEAFPDVTPPRVEIITQWQGRSAEEIEKFVTIPAEVELNSVPGKTSIRSVSLFGLSVITLFFEDGVVESEAQQQVAIRLGAVDFPEGISPEIQPSSGPTGEIYRYTLTCDDTCSARELKTIQDWQIDRQLKSVPGVADVVSFGGEVKTYEVAVNPENLARFNLSPLDVFAALSRSNINVGGDVIVKADQSYVVRGLGLLNSVKEIENVIITNQKGIPILVKKVASVYESAMPSLGLVGRDGKTNQVEAIVLLRRNEDAASVLKSLRLKIEQLNNGLLPPGVHISPFYDRTDLIEHTTKTVTENTLHGILLVIALVFAFLLEWRTGVIVACIIPLALLFALSCLYFMGMKANLLSLGAIDFGIIIDGSVVMVEGLFVILDQQAKKRGMVAFNNLFKSGLIARKGAELGRNILVAQVVIITALLPVFMFQKVEGKMFSPLAWTMGFALLGALIFCLTFVPTMIRTLLYRNVIERHNPVVEWLKNKVLKAGLVCRAWPKTSLSTAFITVGISVFWFFRLGTEFLPQLNEGAIYIRASLPLSSSLDNSIRMSERIRAEILKFPEVKQVLSQTGRPNDGTDPTGFFNIEFHCDLKPAEEWPSSEKKEELIAKMKNKLELFQGIDFNFSQPIMDNVEEAVAGVKGSMAVKLYGQDPIGLEKDAGLIYKTLDKIQGIEDLGIIPLTGQPEVRIELDQERMALQGVNVLDCQATIEMAIGGKAASQLYEGDRKFDIRLRYKKDYRDDESKIGNLLVTADDGHKVPIRSIATISVQKGVAFLYRENNERFIAVKFSVRGRDLGGTIEEAQTEIKKVFPPEKIKRMDWRGEFENQQRAISRLAQTVPLSLTLIFLLLLMLTGKLADALMILFNVPFALVGGVFALHFSGINFSISAGIGFVALLGICIQNGVILLSCFRENLKKRLDLKTAISEGVFERTRPVVMTALIAAIGLTPAALSTGIGSETQKPLAVVVIGGLFSATILTLIIFPVIFETVNKWFKKPNQG